MEDFSPNQCRVAKEHRAAELYQFELLAPALSEPEPKERQPLKGYLMLVRRERM